jgi:hypothetical protein
MYNDAVLAAALYAGVMLAASYVAGEGLPIATHAMSGLAMGAAVLADNVVHNATQMDQTVASSALVTGGAFAAIQTVRGERSSLVRNVAAGAATSIAVGMYN